MKNTTLFGIVVVIVLVAGIFLFQQAGTAASNGISNGNSQQEDNAEVQKITLSTKDYNYYPSTIRAKANQPVSITLDKSVYGCLRSLVIKELGVRAISRTPKQTIDFTPTKKGKFTFSCSMGMGYGTLIVE